MNFISSRVGMREYVALRSWGGGGGGRGLKLVTLSEGYIVSLMACLLVCGLYVYLVDDGWVLFIALTCLCKRKHQQGECCICDREQVLVKYISSKDIQTMA